MDIYDFAEQKRLSIKQIMDFTTSANPLGPSTKAKHLLRKNVNNIGFPPDRKLRYLAGLIGKREALPPDNVLFAQSVKRLLHAIFQAVHAEKVLALSPVSQTYRDMIPPERITVKGLPLNKNNRFIVYLDSILEAMKEVDTVLMSYPHDLVGTALPADDLVILINEADRLGKTLIIDETYRDFTTLKSPAADVIKSERSVILRTFSLFYAMAGLPVAYAVGPADLIRQMGQGIFPEEISILAAGAAIASLKDTFYPARTREFVNTEKTYLLEAFATLSNPVCLDAPCPFVVLAFRQEQDGLRDFFSRYRILIDEFRDEHGGYFIKVPVKIHKWNARFVKTLRNALRDFA